MDKINKLSLPATILIASIILGSFYYASQLSKQKSIEKQQQIELQAIEKRQQAELQAKTLQDQIKEEQTQASLVEKNKLDAQKSAKEALEKQQKEKVDNWINQCITDAYVELKTLQGNYHLAGLRLCLQSGSETSCNASNWEKAEAEAYTTYEKEWIPQCKLGNRVFIHYEPIK